MKKPLPRILLVPFFIFLTICLVCAFAFWFLSFINKQSAQTTVDLFWKNPDEIQTYINLTSSLGLSDDRHLNEDTVYPQTKEDQQKIQDFIEYNCLKTVKDIKYTKYDMSYLNTGTVYEGSIFQTLWGSYTCDTGIRYFRIELLHNELYNIKISTELITN